MSRRADESVAMGDGVTVEKSAGSGAFREAWATDGWVRPYLSRYKGVLAIAIVLSVIANVFAAALMFTSGYMISLAAAIPLTVLALHIPSIFVRIFGIGKPVIQYIERLASHDWVLRMTSDLRVRLYDRLVCLGSGMRSRGGTLGLFAGDIEHVQDLYLRTVFPLVTMTILYVLIVVLAGAFSLALGLLLLVVVGLAAIVLPLWSLAVNGARITHMQHARGRMLAETTEDVIGIGDLRLAGREVDFVKRADTSYERCRAYASEIRSFERRSAVVRQILFGASIAAVFLWASYAFGASAVFDGFFATGVAQGLGSVTMHDSVPYAANWIAAFVLCAFPLLEAFAPASDAMLGFAEHEAAIRELNGLGEDAFGNAVSGCVSFECVEDARISSGWVTEAGVGIRLEGVSFSYESGGKELHNDVSLEVPTGQHLAIIGRSGIGKSTLLGLIRGDIKPLSGRICIGGKVGMIEQAPYVFRKSLRENLLLASPSAEDEDLVCVLGKVGLGKLLDGMPDGLDTLIAEEGMTLSGGERHRLALARILLAECDIVLLDEPYLGLDAQTEREVSDAMFSVFEGKTLVVVTHHLQGIEKYDRVIIVGESGIEADGAPSELAALNAKFAGLLEFERGISK